MKKALATSIFSLFSVGAMAFSPTPAQIQQFQNLPKVQQEQLARQYGVDVSVLTGASSSVQTEPSIPTPSTPQKVQKSSNKQELVYQDIELKPFGYEVFNGNSVGFTVVDDMPVPLDYAVASGDELHIKLYGKTSREISVVVDREGLIHIPEFAPIPVTGQTFHDLRENLTKTIQRQVMGVDVFVSMGAMRTMQVFIAGEVKQPGAYNVNGLTSLTQALTGSGGVKDSGSLRQIQLKRNGKVVSAFDVYDLLLKGDSSNDVRLRNGDTLFVPSKRSTVSIQGQIIRPAIYELKGKTTLSQLISIAGGATANAYLPQVSIKRPTDKGVAQYTIDLSTDTGRQFEIKDGDKIALSAANSGLEGAIALRGAAVRQGAYHFSSGMRISDVISSVRSDLTDNAELDYALVVREAKNSRAISIIQFSIRDALENKGSKSDPLLSERDQIFVFDNGVDVDYWYKAEKNQKLTYVESENKQDRIDSETGAEINAEDQEQFRDLESSQSVQASKVSKQSREALLKPIIERLKEQATLSQPAQLVTIGGAVKFPGVYPVGSHATLEQLIAAAGGLKEEAYLAQADLTRRSVIGDEFAIEHSKIALQPSIMGEDSFLLQTQDHIVVKTKPDWQQDMVIELQGEVVFPGLYSFQRGETLKDVITRAGGFTKFAYPNGAIFSRNRLKRQEQERLELLNMQLKQEIAGLALRRQNSSATYTSSPSEAMAIADELANAEAVGRLVIDLEEAMMGDLAANIMLEKGDKLYIPPVNPTIGVMGEVQYASNHTFKPEMTVEDYLDSAGGTKKQADTDRIYIVRADGSVVLPNNSFWFSRKSKPLAPGDTIIVPIDTDYLDGLSTLTSATQILYQIGVAWSAVKD